MRTIQHGDLMAAARAVVGLEVEEQRRALARLFASAHAADIYRKRTGRVHRCWGNGTLYAAAIPAGGPVPPQADLSNSAYVAALSVVLEALVVWRTRTMRTQHPK